MTFLDKMTASSLHRVETAKMTVPIDAMREMAKAMPKGDFPFKKALAQDGLSFICEIKRASPSRGMISEHFPYLDIAREYEEAGAAAISVLTEPEYFLGSNDYLREVHKAVKTPLLRKDFLVDEYQIYEAKVIGAQAVLLICAMLTPDSLDRLYKIATDLGLSALVETHTAQEIKTAMSAGVDIIGINNRDLNTFVTDINNALTLRDMVPRNTICVAESGIKTPQDMARLYAKGFDGVLIGETLMASADKTKSLADLKAGSTP